MGNLLRVDAPHERVFHGLTEMPDLVTQILDELSELGYTDKERFGVRLSMEEALVNAVKHGNRGDASKAVRVRYSVAEDEFTVEIEDSGPGFRPDRVPDPLEDENLMRPSGRGVFLMQHYMSSVQYNDAGNCVTMCLMRKSL